MGICFSKKKTQHGPPSPTRAASSHPVSPKPLPRHRTETEAATTPPLSQQQSKAATVAAAKKQIFGTTSSSSSNNKDDKDQLGGPTAEAQAAMTATAAAEVEEAAKSTAVAAAASCVNQAIHRNEDAAAPEEDPQVATTVRTSSCSKEEVESILIQCGRLSRNSSGAEARHHRSRKRSYDFDCGTERNVEDEEDPEREKASFSRPSPHRHRHRRTPSRDGDNSEHKRSGSRERGSGSSAGRRMSRSPGRRSDTLMASSSNASSADKSRQTRGKMVSVPAREKTSVPSDVGCGMNARKAAPSSAAAAADGGNKSGSEVGGMRSASPRTRSPANPARSCHENAHWQHHPPQQPQSLSRSSSRKAEQSPYRRNPMAEVDVNVILRGEQPPTPKPNQMQNDDKVQSSRKPDEGTRKPPQSQRGSENTTQTRRHDVRNGAKEVTDAGNNNTARRSVREQLLNCRVKEQRPEQQPAKEELTADVDMVRNRGEVLLPTTGSGMEVPNPKGLTRSRSSRRSSKDLDANPSFNPETLLNPASYTSLLLEDIHNYHQHKNAAAFSLPACVSKACSILEAVADLNSSSSSSSSSSAGNSKVPEAERSHAKMCTGQTQFVESDQAVAKDDRMKPSLRKYDVTPTAREAGIDLEPQESAGSNSFGGQPWGSPWEPNSADSTDRCWTSSWSNNGGDDVMGGEEELISPPDDHRNHRPKHQQQPRSGGAFEASGRRSRGGVAAKVSPAPTVSMSGSSSSHGRGGDSIGAVGGVWNAKVSGV